MIDVSLDRLREALPMLTVSSSSISVIGASKMMDTPSVPVPSQEIQINQSETPSMVSFMTTSTKPRES